MLLGGFLLKMQCTAPEGWDGRQYSRLCYNDIQALYAPRGVEAGIFPYVDGRLEGQELFDGAIEYPVLTGVFMWVGGLLVADPNAYLRITSLLLAPFGLIVAFLIGRMSGLRALMWAAAPAIVLYSFHNWDLLVVAAAVAGLWFWWRAQVEDRSEMPAAVMFGVGAAFKLYPIFLLAPLFLFVLRKRGFGAALGTAAAGVATFVLINLPFALINFDGWIATYSFHSARQGNFDSIWNLGFPSLSAETLNLVTGGLTAAAFLVALGAGWIRARREGVYPFMEVAAAMVAAFLLFSKVHSPQYTLWLLPFFALTSVNIGWWVAYSLVDLAVYVGVFRWFFDFLYEGQDFTFFKKLMIGGVWGRAALCAALFVAFLVARRRGIEPAARTAEVAPAPAAPAEQAALA